ncbi:ABC transporter ATP-binding protein [Armatimonas rosea]|uniref:Multiple sugar transport system ATP-binding protein n=1 Tax=Armatimonas rosea TaxID=685828 RepID=A0A7W9SSW4_ARMRO|nr:sn-glycerol-3-phosphate ABC transporter ATP-binding protein UgpC [Armatimonas rosea]MBB6051775.1 multiple sugar transport system ATP-binding protein [Armatimonas rosea]
MAKVILRNLNKTFVDQQSKKEVNAVKDLDLEIHDGEFMVLVGPSGCGKTTTMRMVAGLEEVTSGEILIGERVVNDVPPRDRNIAMVFQNYALYPHMSVYENMAFGLRLRMLPPIWQKFTPKYKEVEADIDAKIQAAARKLDITQYLDRKPKALSGGQRQRVALGRAIVRDPEVFLMDEPLSNLDAKLRVQTRFELINLHRELKVTTIYVTHDQVEAMTMGQRIAVMNNGLLQQCDTPQNIYRHPANMFVAGFIGMPPMNFVKGATVKMEGGTPVIDCGGFSVTLGTDRAAVLAPYVGKEVVFGVRPEHLNDKALVSGTPSNVVRAQVEVIEQMGATSNLYISLGGHALVSVVDASTVAKENAPLDIVIDADHCHVFDKDTEKAIF